MYPASQFAKTPGTVPTVFTTPISGPASCGAMSMMLALQREGKVALSRREGRTAEADDEKEEGGRTAAVGAQPRRLDSELAGWAQ